MVEAEEREGGAGEEDEGLVEGEVGWVEGFVGAVGFAEWVVLVGERERWEGRRARRGLR